MAEDGSLHFNVETNTDDFNEGAENVAVLSAVALFKGGSLIIGAISAVVAAIGWVPIAIAAIIVAIIAVITYWDKIKLAFQTGVEMWKSGVEDIKKSASNLWNKLKDGVESAFPWLVSSIEEHIDGVKKIFTGIIDFVKGVFTGDWKKAWNGIKEIFSGIWESLSAVIKTPINLVIDIDNKFISGIEDKINTLLDCVNTLSFDIPDWVPGIGGEHVGFDFSHIDIPEIPHLARGTVVPANYGEFLAVLGDNKKEREFVTPESSMTKAMINALHEVGLTGGRNDGDIVINIDGREIFRVTKKEADKYKRTHGKTAFS
ncbi:MAG: hypothetical protein K2M82_07190 [Lachnospiraceae bacterium]|nr:hypothetical protein [Lachnospiraceae bacterium]